MCGIAGVVGRRVTADALRIAADVMRQRGPDEEGVWHDDACGLAFRRLAIIDLDKRSGQPMHLGALHLVFNGELYNYVELRSELERLGHRFRTAGDGEVLLHAWAQWGEGALDRFNGMFAFAVWDAGSRRLHVAVDPFAEKPLLLWELGGALAFASDARALTPLLGRRPQPDDDAMAAYLATGTMPVPPCTFFSGVQRLPAAHVGTWDAASGFTARRYWSPARRPVPERYEDAADELRELLTDAVRVRLRSDVPVGTSLSGGVDSSAIVALAGRLEPDARRHAFTARFPGFARDEGPWAKAVAEMVGVERHHGVEPTLSKLLDGDLQRLVADQGEPFASTSIYAQWSVNRCAREAGVTVLLDGQGADELFAGYPGLEAFAAAQSGPRTAAGALVRGRVGAVALARAASSGRLPARISRGMRTRAASPYATAEVAAVAASQPVIRCWDRASGGALRRELLTQCFASSLPSLLRYADRGSMAHSREVRLPFLDRRVAEFALSCPERHLFRGGVTKSVLREAVGDLVPAAVLDRREKVGFETPEQRWLNDERLRAYAADVLLDPAARSRPLLNLRALESDLARDGDWSDARGAWRALNLELWQREWT